MKRAREGELTTTDLGLQDVAYLRRALGRDAVVERTRLLVRRKAGLWLLPSGSALLVEPRKGNGADLFAWICAVDPRIVGSMRDVSPSGSATGSVAEVAIRVFCAALLAIQRRYGARQEYRQQVGRSAALRGRVDWAAYAREPLPVHVPCTYWQRQLDTPLNRMLASVLHFARQHELLRRAGGAELRHLADIFGHVPAKCPPELLHLERPLPRAENAYEALRRLAALILDGAGLAHGGSAPALQFEVDLARLFERSVEAALLLGEWKARPRFQVRPPYEGDNGGWSAIDALVTTKAGPIVVDAKYASGFSKEHLYQVLAYMKMVDAHHGILVYPEGAQLGSRRYRSAGPHRWEVRVLELDPVRIGQEGDRELRRLAQEVSWQT